MPLQPVILPETKPKAERKPRKTKVYKEYVPGPGPFGMVKQAAVDRIVRTEREALYWMEQEPGWIGLDLETSGLNPYRDMVLVMGLYGPETRTAAVLHIQGYIEPELRSWLGGYTRRFVTQNGLNFDIPYLYTHGVDVYAPGWFDTLVAEQVVTGTDRKGISKNLQAIVKRRLGVDISKDVDHRDWVTDELTEMQTRYVAEDISFLPAIMETQWLKAREVDDKWGKNEIYGTGVEDALKFEMELLPIVLRMQLNGLPVHAENLYAYEALQRNKAAAALEWLTAEFGPEINWGSHVQVKKAFLAHYDVPLASTQEDELILLRDLATGSKIAEAVDQLLVYKHAAKRSSMYNAEFIDKYVYDGRVRASFRPVGTETGRFSSSSPNLQQIPGDGRNWIGDPDGLLEIVAPDYSQIEIRIAANEAEDSALTAALAAEDVHTMIASQVFGIAPEAVTKDQRKLSKAMSFTLLFGGGAARLSHYATVNGANLPIEESAQIVAAFFDRFRGLKKVRRQAHSIVSHGRPFTLVLPTGIRRVLTPGVDLTANRILNNIVQGTAAAGLKYGLMEAAHAGLITYLGATVHDENVAAVPTAYAEEYGKELARAMIKGMERVCENVPVKVEVKRGATWS
jgi:DNA polymerase-1